MERERRGERLFSPFLFFHSEIRKIVVSLLIEINYLLLKNIL
ncbi:hypothetical protein HMPREF9441_00851 [Paraprevotella clara YIT 11840]|uniref:Uncharacterized protein n=2 Tax=Paraprevotella clara TaxID=454154 RepID=G5SNC2_9BACT|nr:hypothetical protein HMPREF9441_00851 [Paraprevotella clara YIT 11840]